jgi:hypothetical protein
MTRGGLQQEDWAIVKRLELLYLDYYRGETIVNHVAVMPRCGDGWLRFAGNLSSAATGHRHSG